MKKQLLTIILALIISSVFAQENNSESIISNSSTSNHEVGIDVTGIIGLLGASNIYYSPYYLNYKYYHNNNSFHIGVGGHINSSTETEEQLDGIELKDINNEYRIGLGYNYNKQLGEKWLINYGVEFCYERRNYISEYMNSDGIRSQIQDRNTYGLGPNIGIRYKISDNVAIGTETFYFFNYYSYRHGHEYEDNPELNSTSKSVGYSTQYYPPYSILLTIRF